MLANFKPLRGNYGVDGGVYPVRVDSYFPNDFGLYNMAGNVSEWTRTSWDEANNAFAHDLNGESYTFIKERGKEDWIIHFVRSKKSGITNESWRKGNGHEQYSLANVHVSFVASRSQHIERLNTSVA
ncbi:MAG: hypothetical protein EBT60_07950 [Bacteroidetes bacterium]|nr:hypothetical protein [Bacteroidota bacterium]